MLKTLGRKKVIAVNGNMYIVQVTNCRNVEGETVLSSHDTAYYETFAFSKSEAIQTVTNGGGNFLYAE